MASYESLARMQFIYIAYYGRPADPGGQEFWAGRLDAQNGDLSQIIDAFGDSQEFDDNFGNLSNQALITNLYQQMFNRSPDPVGLEFFTNRLSSGEASLASIAVQIADGAAGLDIFTLNNKKLVADAFTASIAETDAAYGAPQLEVVKSVLSGVTSDGVTGAAAMNLYDPLVDSFPSPVDTDESYAVQAVFVAILARAATTDELAQWVDDLKDDDGALADLATNLLASPEYQGGTGADGQISTVFLNLFGRDADSGALNFYSERLDDGEPLGGLISEIADSAVGDDRRTIDNRVSIAMHATQSLTENLASDGDRFADLFRAILNDVNGDTDSYIGAVYEVTSAAAIGSAGDNISNSTSTSSSIGIDGQVSSNIGAADDHDWFRVNLDSERRYSISVTGTGSVDAEFPGVDTLRLALFDQNGDWLGDWSSSEQRDPNLSLERLPETAETLFVAIEGAGNWIGSYTVRVDALSEPDDFAGDTSTEGALTVGIETQGVVGIPQDKDWFRVELEDTGHNYTIVLDGSGDTATSGSESTLALLLYDENGAPLGISDQDSGRNPDPTVDFVPDVAGTYYVGVEGQSSWTGSYHVAVFDLTQPVDDFAGDETTTGTVSVENDASGNIEIGGDKDWFAITLQAGVEYTFDLLASDSGGGTLTNSRLRLYDSTGTQLTSNNATGSDAQIVRNETQGGLFYLSVEGTGVDDIGTYTVSVGANEPDPNPEPQDIPGDDTTTISLAAGGQLTSTIDAAFEADWIRVELVEGTRYIFDLRGAGTGNGTLKDPLLQLRNSTSIPRASDDDDGSGLNSQIQFTADASDVYYLDARGKGNNSTGTYTLSFFNLDSDIPGSTDSVVSLAVDGAPVESAISTQTDSDWMSVYLLTDAAYQFTLFTDPTLAAGLRLYDANGNEVDIGNQAGATQVRFEPDAAGTYFVSVDATSGSGSYNLSAANVSTDILGGPGTTEIVELGEEVRSDIEDANDTDWFRIELDANDQYIFELLGKITGDGSLEDPVLTLFKYVNNQQVSETSDDNGGIGANSQLVVTADETSSASVVYYLAAGGKGEGDYLLTAINVGPEIPDEQNSIGTLSPGQSAFSYIGEAFDEDWFRVELTAGKTYEFDMNGRVTDDGTLVDPKLILYDANGVSRAIDDNGDSGVETVVTNAALLYTPQSDGTYYIAASASNGQDLGTYTLTFVDLL